ncbi:MAG: hypothetical protein QNK37_37400 [Acidobacteriota bacterium]|nr:hypothetical protein [Acidobacteriota bacterium]
MSRSLKVSAIWSDPPALDAETVETFLEQEKLPAAVRKKYKQLKKP